jgi:hypothetical protein
VIAASIWILEREMERVEGPLPAAVAFLASVSPLMPERSTSRILAALIATRIVARRALPTT